MHHDTAIDPTTEEPEIILCYNATKSGMDTADQMANVYNCACLTSCWPVVVFFHLMNCAAINAYVLYQQLHPQARKTQHEFLAELITALTLPQTEI